MRRSHRRHLGHCPISLPRVHAVSAAFSLSAKREVREKGHGAFRCGGCGIARVAKLQRPRRAASVERSVDHEAPDLYGHAGRSRAMVRGARTSMTVFQGMDDMQTATERNFASAGIR